MFGEMLRERQHLGMVYDDLGTWVDRTHKVSGILPGALRPFAGWARSHKPARAIDLCCLKR